MKRKLDVEPLEDARWERIERGLRDRVAAGEARERSIERGSSVRAPILLLCGAAATIVGAVAWEKLRPAQHVESTVATTTIETRDAPSHVQITGATLDVEAHTGARVDSSNDRGVLVLLDHGAVEFDVTPREGRPPFVVRAGDVDVRVVGTHFRVEREDSVTHVRVDKGVVEVEASGKTVRVAAGASWPETARATTAATAPEAPTPIASVVKPLTPATTTTVATTASVVVAQPSPRERYDRALTLEATRPDEASAIYRELAAGSDSWAMNALYAEARLDLERGNKTSARALFAEYVRRYPTGPNANDARDLAAKLQ